MPLAYKPIFAFLAGLLLIFAASGCSTLKQCAPNSWNVTWYEGDQFRPGQNMVGFGVSGALPWGKQ
jgi:hypothetical protein